MSRTTVTKFFSQQPVSQANFQKICVALRMNWMNVSTEANCPEPATNELAKQSQSDEISIQELQENNRKKILRQHGWMRLLSGEEIRVNQIYVDVWLLNRESRSRYVSKSKLLETFDLRSDRLGLGTRIERKSGLLVANKQHKLVVLGKPGSGKTTYLKHLAIDWAEGNFWPQGISIFIELRKMQTKNWQLLDAITHELEWSSQLQFRELCDAFERAEQASYDEPPHEDIHMLHQEIERRRAFTQLLLREGILLLLLDGLDEVPTSELRADVQLQLRQLSKKYPKTRFILTCRTQILKVIPEGFVSVEVADFNIEQAKKFFENWFKLTDSSDEGITEKWNKVNTHTDGNPSLMELTTTPVLLSLLCLVIQDEGDIPSNRDWLYRKGINLLLSKWNENKNIIGWSLGSETYRSLGVEEKEALLIKIAASKFDNPRNYVLFEQTELVEEITEHLKLPNRKEGLYVLRAIEAQHGLLIERADELWSFSHLTFQEYFTVKWLNQLPLESLIAKVGNRMWQESVIQLVKSQHPANVLISSIKQAIDQLISDIPEINVFLSWVWQKEKSIESCYKTASVRAFYLELALGLPYGLKLAASLEGLGHAAFLNKLNLDEAVKENDGIDFAFDAALKSMLCIDFAADFSEQLSCALNLAIKLDPDYEPLCEKLLALTNSLRRYDQDYQNEQLKNAEACLEKRKGSGSDEERFHPLEECQQKVIEIREILANLASNPEIPAELLKEIKENQMKISLIKNKVKNRKSGFERELNVEIDFESTGFVYTYIDHIETYKSESHIIQSLSGNLILRSLDIAQHINPTIDRNRIFELKSILEKGYNQAVIPLAAVCSSSSIDEFNQLRRMLPLPTLSSWESCQTWWNNSGEEWIRRLHSWMIEYRNIGHNWEFSKKHRELLELYYDTNYFLSELLNIKDSVNEDVRNRIENSILTPSLLDPL